MSGAEPPYWTAVAAGAGLGLRYVDPQS
jgi:hypothetical protein